MNKICTSIGQSQRLIELGFDRKSSDMFYWCGEDLRIGGYKAQSEEFDISAWSLTALLRMMPKSIISTPNPFSDNYCCRNVEFDMEFYADNPVDAAFETLSWLLENKKL